MSKPKIEYRVVCAKHGKDHGHTSHAWVKKEKKKAEQSVIDLNHSAEMNRTHFYAGEAPYVIEEREVAAWKVSE